MGMTVTCPGCGHSQRSSNRRGARIGTCPNCGTQMRAHTAGKAKGRYICPIRGGVFTHGLGGSVQLAEPMRLAFVPGWDDDRYEPDPDRPGWNRRVTYHRDTPRSSEQDELDRAAGRVFGPSCVVTGGYQQPAPDDPQHRHAGVYLVPAPGADPATWFVNEPVTYKKCAACPRRVVVSDKSRMDREWVPARESFMYPGEVNQGPHPAGTYACRDCRPKDADRAQVPAQAANDGQVSADGAQDRGQGHAGVHDAMARLAGVCDFAESQDGQGFNATDTWLGHVLAAMPVDAWGEDEALAAWEMLRKYRAQLVGFGITYDHLPRPAGAEELEAARREEARERARQRGRQWREQQYRKANSYVRCNGEGEQVMLTFTYDPAMVDEAKKITGRSFDWDTKTNVYPFTSLPPVVAFAEAHGIEVAPEVRALMPSAAAQAEQEAAGPNVYTDQVGRVVIAAEYNPALNEALKKLNGDRSTWDRTARVHRPPIHRHPMRVLGIADEFGLTVDDDARAVIEAEIARQEHNRAAATAFEADPVPVPGLAEGLALKPQQYPVVRFALDHRRVLIGDDMGWGKTLSSLAAMAADGAYPAVVVCRPSLTLNWVAEIRRFFPALAVHEASGTSPQPIPGGTDVVVIGSAALAAKPHTTTAGGKQFGWVKTLAAAAPKALIIDEGQDTKERAANRSQACEQLAAAVTGADGLVLDLTGTAILNQPRELCQQLTILGRITEFGGPKAFLWRYCLAEVNEWGASYNGARHLTELHDRLLRWGIMIRRSDDAKLGLPPCREHVLVIPEAQLDSAVMARYRQAEADLLGYLAERARQAAGRLGTDPTSAAVQAAMRAQAAEHLVAINTLRQLAGHAKRAHVTSWVGERVAAGEKVMVAAHHRGEVDHYAATFGGLKLQGGQPVADKEAAKAAFQKQPASEAPVIAVAIGAGGVGHTLTAAAIGIQAEQAWTPGETQQMKKRLHRIGQDRPVDYYITVAAGTIDEHLREVVAAKQATLNAVLDGESDEGAADDEGSVIADVTWRLTQQGLGGPPGNGIRSPQPGASGPGNGGAALAHRPGSPAGTGTAAGSSASESSSGQQAVASRENRPPKPAGAGTAVGPETGTGTAHDRKAVPAAGVAGQAEADTAAAFPEATVAPALTAGPEGRGPGVGVYVDDMNMRADVHDGATVVRGRWSHLFADTETELRVFAAKIGLDQAWIQHPGTPHVHFDVTARMRQRAIAAGATPVTWRQAGEFFAGRARDALIPVDAPVTSLLLISGPRDGVSKETVRAALTPKFATNVMLIAGGARGVDTYAAQLWREWGGLVEEHQVTAQEWDRNPRGAGHDRNAAMVERVKTAGGSVLVIDLPCTTPGCPRPQPHNTHGTSGCARLAEQAGLPVEHYQAPSADGAHPPGGRTPQSPAPYGSGAEGDGGAARGRALRQAAYLYLGHGLLPVPGWGAAANGACRCPRGVACPRPGKHPRSVHAGPGEHDYSWKPLACHTHDEVDQRFADGGPYATGNLMLAIPPGMLVIDQDDDDGGPQAIATLTGQLGELPPTLAHPTPHGVHRIYRTPPGWTGRAWVGKDTRNPLPPGVDLRVPGQILMAAPSQVPTGDGLAAYGPVSAIAVAELPTAYLAAWTPPQHETVRRRPVAVPPDRADVAASYVHARVEGIAADLAEHEPGGRGTAIYTAALKAGSTLGAARTTPGAEHAAAEWTDRAAEDKLMEAAEANGYVAKHGAAAARSAIRSGLRNGLRNPRSLPDFTASQAAHQGTARAHSGAARDAGQARQAQAEGESAAPGADTSPGTDGDGTAQAQRESRVEASVEDTVSGVLGAAGYPASTNRRDTGWGEGFRVHPQPSGSVLIGHEAVAEDIGGATAWDRVQQMTDRYARTLQDAGYQVTSQAPGSLTVTPQPGDRQAGAAVSPSQAREATRAAVTADEAYRARDFDRARRFINLAAELDPSRAGLWAQHRAEITAKQLFTQATAAKAVGDRSQVEDLLEQCRELDPRLDAQWHRHLTGIRNGQATSQPAKTATGRAASHGQQHGRPKAQERASSPRTGPQWPNSPARISSPEASGEQASTQPEKAGHGDKAAPGTTERERQRARHPDALEPQRHQSRDQHETQTRQAAAGKQPRQMSHDTETAPCPQCGDSYVRPVGESCPCLSCQTQARLKAAGYTPDRPEIQQIADWNRAVHRRGDRQQETPQQPEANPSEPETHGAALPGEAESREREKEACG